MSANDVPMATIEKLNRNITGEVNMKTTDCINDRLHSESVMKYRISVRITHSVVGCAKR